VHAVLRRVGWLDQVRPGERHQQSAGVSHCSAHQGGTGIRFYAAARVQAQQPEGTRGVVVEMLVGPGEYRADSGSRIASAAQQVKPLMTVLQLPHQPGKRCRGASCGEFSRRAQGEWQAGAQHRQPPGCGRIRLGPAAYQ
jgi:hypothetical protein